jgi:transcriptional regulator with XRE-family HTH domain
MAKAREINVAAMRDKSGLSQEAFWGRIGVSQSGGSRYESDRKMPRAVKELVRLVYIEEVDLSRVQGGDIAIINFLKEQYPDLLKTLKKAAKSARS